MQDIIEITQYDAPEYICDDVVAVQKQFLINIKEVRDLMYKWWESHQPENNNYDKKHFQDCIFPLKLNKMLNRFNHEDVLQLGICSIINDIATGTWDKYIHGTSTPNNNWRTPIPDIGGKEICMVNVDFVMSPFLYKWLVQHGNTNEVAWSHHKGSVCYVLSVRDDMLLSDQYFDLPSWCGEMGKRRLELFDFVIGMMEENVENFTLEIDDYKLSLCWFGLYYQDNYEDQYQLDIKFNNNPESKEAIKRFRTIHANKMEKKTKNHQ